MLQGGQSYTLNHTAHSFFAYSLRNFGYRASFAYFYLTAVSQHDHHASAQINRQMVLFNQM